MKILINTPTFSISKTYNILKSLGYKIGKETIKKYIQYAENAFFINQLHIFSPKIKSTLMYPRKIYIADNIFIKSIGIKYDYGRLLENLVYIELKRVTEKDPTIEIRYWKDKEGKEVDFLIIKNGEVKKIIQVSWDPTDYDVRKRETKSLIKAGKHFNIKTGYIITFEYEDREIINNKEIHYIPIWKILMKKQNLI